MATTSAGTREDIRARLLGGQLVVGDGAMGTQAQILDPKALCPEQLLFTMPERIEDIHRRYVEAGAEIILTNTFGGSPHKLALAHMEGVGAHEVNRRAAEIARRAAGEYALVAGDIGPLGELVEPLGDISEGEALDNFRQQIGGLVDGGVDAIIIETVIDLAELRLAVAAMRELCRLPLIVSMTFDKVVDGYRTMMGTTPEETAEAALGLGADVVGCNCGLGIADHIEIVKRLRAVVSGPIMCQPNAGLPRLAGGKVVYLETPESMSAQVPALVDAGATVIGGCCGTTADYVRLARAAMGLPPRSMTSSS
ncbi:homocysteine S-methyltransferase family protein [bacterium]|nr:homocysteine S-methyltransferase family protein [bacterium]